MAEVIYKYPVPLMDDTRLHFPEPARIIHVGQQRGNLTVWAIVDPERHNAEVNISVRGTGHPLDGNEGPHVGTVQTNAGYVWHIFARVEKFTYIK